MDFAWKEELLDGEGASLYKASSHYKVKRNYAKFQHRRAGTRRRHAGANGALLREDRAAAVAGANYRTYGSGDLDRLIFVRRARDIGFSIDQIRNLLDLSDQREHDCGTVDCLAREHLDAIEQKIADLVALKIQLSGLLSSCGGGRVADCRIIDALSRRD